MREMVLSLAHSLLRNRLGILISIAAGLLFLMIAPSDRRERDQQKSSTQQHQPSQGLSTSGTQTATETAQQASDDRFWAKWGTIADWWMIGITLAAVVAALMSLGIIDDQTKAAKASADASRDSADAAKDALYLLEGASVQLQQVDLDVPENPSSPIEALWNSTVTLKWRNYGRSIAMDFTSKMNLGLDGSRHAQAIDRQPELVIAPEQTLAWSTPRLGALFTPEDVKAVLEGGTKLFLYGTASYSDVFGRKTTIEVEAEWAHGTTGFTWVRYESTQTNPPKNPQQQS